MAALDEALGDRDLTRDELVSLLAFRDQVDARVARRVGAFDQRAEWAFDGAVSPVQWLTSHALVAPDDARRLLVLGAACRRLPVTAAAVTDGTMSVGQVRQITNHLSDQTIELFAEHETELVPTLAPLPLRQVSWAMARWQRHAETALSLEQVDELPDRSLHLSRSGGAGGGSTVTSTPKAALARHRDPSRHDPRRRRRTRAQPRPPPRRRVRRRRALVPRPQQRQQHRPQAHPPRRHHHHRQPPTRRRR